jgi:chorismate mutase
MTNLLQFDEPFLIAGPCSAETPEQVLATAREIAKNKKVKAFRAGVWKPRTRPGSFEGAGAPALEWLKQVKNETGLPITVEVANANHVEEALKASVDILWIGARTTVNPFSVQEIADALKGVNVPVMVKNPVTPDMQLWIGAMERLQRVGIQELVAIHRGFTSYDKSKYRNPPQWEMAIEFRRLMPNIPMICDPSHISGNTILLFHVAQTALDLDMNGLMIETHINPNEAWSDAKQQITPDELDTMLQTLVIKNRNSDNTLFLSQLEELRKKIDRIDTKLLEVLAERMDLVRQIGEYKRDNQVTVLQISRWSEIVEQRIKSGISLGLEEETIKKLLDLIHIESIRLQESIINSKTVI